MCEFLIDRKFFAHFFRSQVTELMEVSLEVRLRKILVQKRFGQFLIWIRIRDSDPDSNPGFDCSIVHHVLRVGLLEKAELYAGQRRCAPPRP